MLPMEGPNLGCCLALSGCAGRGVERHVAHPLPSLRGAKRRSNPLFLCGRTDCRVASLLAMTVERAEPNTPVIPAKAGIQYAAAYRFNHWRLWNTGSPGPGYAKGFAEASPCWLAGALAEAASRAMTAEIVLAARCARSFAITLPSPIRGRREDRVRAAPAVSCAMCIKKCCT